VLRQPAIVSDGERHNLRGTSLRFTETFYASEGSLAGWRFEPSIPALVRPMVFDARAETTDWIAIELNRDVIQTRIFLISRSDTSPELMGLDYMIAVVAGTGSRELIYSSDPDFGAEEVADADGRMTSLETLQPERSGPDLRVSQSL